MKECRRCHVYIKDNSNICPLCKELLTPTDETSIPMYPKIAFDTGKFNLVKKIIMFAAIVTAVVLFIINYATYSIAPVLWSLISVAAILYGVITVYYSILNNSNLAAKLLVQTIGASILCVIIDYVLGYKGWSVNFMIPSFIILSDLGIILLMIVNPMNKKTYFLYQLTVTIFSAAAFGLTFTRLIARKEFAFIAGLVCVITLIGSIIFGDKGFKNELIRRFHL